ncbi:MAG: ATP-binding protein [Candidatus Uhrbacteria bacterium]|nr:ATP-binding protein [Candidatus Uhrbacteria bacterium]
MKPMDDLQVQTAVATFATENIVHDKGLFILAPSGSGKTYFVKNQAEKHWIDGDQLWNAAGAHPEGPWWTESLEIINEVDRRSDVVTRAAKAKGLWILGASNFDLPPDAIVIPPEATLREYIHIRETTDYDGGATSDRFDQVLGHITWMKDTYEKMGVPIFSSVAEAVRALV